MPTAPDLSPTQVGRTKTTSPFPAQHLLCSDDHLESFISPNMALFFGLLLKFRCLSFDPKTWGVGELQCFAISFLAPAASLVNLLACFYQWVPGSWFLWPPDFYSNITPVCKETRTKTLHNCHLLTLLTPTSCLYNFSSSLNICVYMRLPGRYFINEYR